MDSPMQMLVSLLDSDNFLGRIVVGRVHNGCVRVNMPVKVLARDGQYKELGRLTKLFSFRGNLRVPIQGEHALYQQSFFIRLPCRCKRGRYHCCCGLGRCGYATHYARISRGCFDSPVSSLLVFIPFLTPQALLILLLIPTAQPLLPLCQLILPPWPSPSASMTRPLLGLTARSSPAACKPRPRHAHVACLLA
jgi:hypothetical protein